MTKVIVNKSINVSADEAWQTLSSFRGIEDYSPVERSETEGSGAGAKRTCFMPDGAAIFEVLNFTDNANMEMQYKITEGPFPITGYVSDVKISPAGTDSCNINWECEFESSEEVKEGMEKLFRGFYEVIIDSLEGYISTRTENVA